VLLPGCSFFEKNSAFMDSQGGFRFSNKLMPSFGLARDESLLILRFASGFLSNIINVNLDTLRALTLITATAGSFPLTSTKIKKTSSFISKPQFSFSLAKGGFNKSTLLTTVVNFYKTDVATNLSKNLAFFFYHFCFFFIFSFNFYVIYCGSGFTRFRKAFSV
jgi:hypothetical protein